MSTSYNWAQDTIDKYAKDITNPDPGTKASFRMTGIKYATSIMTKVSGKLKKQKTTAQKTCNKYTNTHIIDLFLGHKKVTKEGISRRGV